MPSDVSRLHPLRVLLAGTDRPWLRVAQVLLERRGYVVHATDAWSDIAAVIRRSRSNVVVLDVGTSLTAAARTIAAIDALQPRIGVVAVGDRQDRALAGIPLLPKWDGLDRLGDELERAHLRDGKSRGPRSAAG